MRKLFRQAELQTGAAEPRGVAIKWYFAEEWAANYVREKFEKDGRYNSTIIIGYMAPSNGQ